MLFALGSYSRELFECQRKKVNFKALDTKPDVKLNTRATPEGEGEGEGGNSHIKRFGMLFMSLRGLNLDFLVSLRMFRMKHHYFKRSKYCLAFT